ncbi:LOW QUALITY PROTEIN: group 3 secretory phospholipase A2 [Gracilinanus agilis]|uniref:LOW QUALITY PROTEIN: group 3 secretory phospholipase A2 n=1 Tax=Gracilinanus agilis TaxID=191870 RepID=UPI001CFF1450|nr:LOW QUALITY PROTEIN: group 3 secretory phospholipase A2 [Gracilinanus agilis]
MGTVRREATNISWEVAGGGEGSRRHGQEIAPESDRVSDSPSDCPKARPSPSANAGGPGAPRATAAEVPQRALIRSLPPPPPPPPPVTSVRLRLRRLRSLLRGILSPDAGDEIYAKALPALYRKGTADTERNRSGEKGLALVAGSELVSLGAEFHCPGMPLHLLVLSKSADHPICFILRSRCLCLPACLPAACLPAGPSIHWSRRHFSPPSPRASFASAPGQPRGTLWEWAEGEECLGARGAEMGHPRWLLWVLIPVGVVLAKGKPVPRFIWNNTFCHLAVPRTVPTSPLRTLSFLSPGPQGLALFHASWDGQGHLLECAHWEEAAIVLPYQAACARERGKKTSLGIFAHALSPGLQQALEALQEQQDVCGSSSEEVPPRPGQEATWGQGTKGQVEEEEEHLAASGHRRVKRGWTMPGTLWCGVGNSAGNSTELGLFQGPDLCCREHDRCAHNISPFEFNYGIRNYRFHTISHCDCDTRFQGCLQSQQDAISNFVGTTFFNLLEIPCFVLEEKEECIQWYWWGGCKKYGPIPRARLLQPSRFNVTQIQLSQAEKPSRRKQPKQRHGGQHRRSKGHRSHFQPPPTLSSNLQKANISAQAPSPTLPHLAPNLGSPQVGTTPGKSVKVVKDHHAQGGSQDGGQRPGGTQVSGGPTEGAAEGPLKAPTTGEGTPKPTFHPADKTYQDFSKTCQCYRELDRCQHKIEPRETKYQLRNPGSHTLFHCNCTRRLAKVLRTKSPNEVEDKLWNLLALTCFKLEPPEDCGPSSGCRGGSRAVMVPARHLRRLWKKQAGWQSKVPGKKKRRRERRLQAGRRGQEHGGTTTLYDKCLRRISAGPRAAQ